MESLRPSEVLGLIVYVKKSIKISAGPSIRKTKKLLEWLSEERLKRMDRIYKYKNIPEYD